MRRVNWPTKVWISLALVIALTGYLLLDWGLLGNVPINFHGLVTDETGSPIPGAIVTARIHVARPSLPILWGPSRGSTVVRTVTTDSKGRFEFSGRGFGVSIADVQKAGYTAAGSSASYY